MVPSAWFEWTCRASTDAVYGALDKFSTAATAAKNLVGVTVKELGSNLRLRAVPNIEYAEVCLAFLSRHLEFAGGAEDEDDSEGSCETAPWEGRPPDPKNDTRKKGRKVEESGIGAVKEHGCALRLLRSPGV